MAIPERRIKPKLDEIRQFAGVAASTEPSPVAEAQTSPQVQAKQEEVAKPRVKAEKTGAGEGGEAKAKGSNFRGNKEIITCGFKPDFLDHIEEAASILNINRTAFINQACSHLVKEVYREYLGKIDGSR